MVENWKPYFLLIVIDLAFAVVNVLLKKVLDEGINHLVLITYRLSFSAAFLGPIGYFWERNDRPRLTFRIICYLFLSSIVGAFVPQYLFLLGIQYTSATFSCAFLNMVPVVTFIMALPFRMESASMKTPSGRGKIIGALVCVGGAIMLTAYRGMPLINHEHSQALSERPLQSHGNGGVHYQSFKGKAGGEKWAIGCVFMIVGTFMWSSWFLIQSRIGKAYPCQYSSTAIMSFFGALQSAIFCISTHRTFSIWVIKGTVKIATVLYAGMVGSGLCIVGMSWCVKKRGPVFTAAFSPLVQIMAAMFDVPILHEELHLGSVLGSSIVIIGLYFLLWGKSKEIVQDPTTKVTQEEVEAIKNQDQSPSKDIPSLESRFSRLI